MNRYSLTRETEPSIHFEGVSLVLLLPFLLQFSNGARQTVDSLSDLGRNFNIKQFQLGDLVKRSYPKSLEISNRPIVNQ